LRRRHRQREIERTRFAPTVHPAGLPCISFRNDVQPQEEFMIRKLLAGAVLGFIGKKLYDKRALDPYIERAKEAFDQAQVSDSKAPPVEPKSSPA
jgi:hypothetical protein